MMKEIRVRNTLQPICMGVLMPFVVFGPASALEPRYAEMAPVERYHIDRQAEEIALARSAAPASISDSAEVLTLGAKGYETAVEGDNGFVCVVQRSWANDFNSDEFWNPKVRAPICFNRSAALSVLSTYLTRTEWVLAGMPQEEMIRRTEAAIAANDITPPTIGAMCYMMSKKGYLSDENPDGWKPHLMFFLPRTQPSEWGANLSGVPVFAGQGNLEPITVFMSVVPYWSDGTQKR